MNVFEISATNLLGNLAAKFAHATEPAILITCPELDKLFDIGMWQNLEPSFFDTLDNRICNLFRTGETGD